MIYTVTLNPSIDYYVTCDMLSLGMTNRASLAETHVGGKGINVSIMLSKMGIESTALGFVAGFTGDEIESELSSEGIKTDFIHLTCGMSRINVKVSSGKPEDSIESDSEETRCETELNAPGPIVSDCDIHKLMAKFEMLSASDTVVMSGSIPKSVPKDIYEQIASVCSKKGIRFIVDVEGNLLTETLKHKPFLVKPNHHELGDMFGVTIDNDSVAAVYGRKLIDMGAENVIVTMAEKGAVLLTGTGISMYHEALTEDIVNEVGTSGFANGVGAGDSMVAGFLAGYEQTKDYIKAFWWGLSAASATAFSTGLADEKLIKNILGKVLTTP